MSDEAQLPRFCENGCTAECFAIWDERAREISTRVKKRADRAREERQRKNHELANGPRHVGSLQPIGELISTALFKAEQAPNGRSRLRVLEGGRS